MKEKNKIPEIKQKIMEYLEGNKSIFTLRLVMFVCFIFLNLVMVLVMFFYSV